MASFVPALGLAVESGIIGAFWLASHVPISYRVQSCAHAQIEARR